MKTALVLGALVAMGCGKTSGASTTEPAPSASAVPAPSVSAAASASAAPTAASTTWHGTYKSSAAPLQVPPDFAKTWAHADHGAGTGEGPMTLALDGASGRASGTLEGPLGPALVAGDVTGGTLTAAVSRKDPSDRGFTGTLRATVSGAQIDGTMTLASADGSQQRTATVTLTSAAP